MARSRAYDALGTYPLRGGDRTLGDTSPAMTSGVRMAEDLRTHLQEMPLTSAETAPLPFPAADPRMPASPAEEGGPGTATTARPRFHQPAPGVGPLSRLDTAVRTDTPIPEFHETARMAAPPTDVAGMARSRDATVQQPQWRGQADVAAGEAATRMEGQASLAVPADRSGPVQASQPAGKGTGQAGQASNHMTLSGTLTLQADGTGRLEGTAGSVPRP